MRRAAGPVDRLVLPSRLRKISQEYGRFFVADNAVARHNQGLKGCGIDREEHKWALY
jgi:hypothetical protein